MTSDLVNNKAYLDGYYATFDAIKHAYPPGQHNYVMRLVGHLAKPDLQLLLLGQGSAGMVDSVAGILSTNVRTVHNVLKYMLNRDFTDRSEEFRSYLSLLQSRNRGERFEDFFEVSDIVFLLGDEICVWDPDGECCDTVEYEDLTEQNVAKGIIVARGMAFENSLRVFHRGHSESWPNWQRLPEHM